MHPPPLSTRRYALADWQGCDTWFLRSSSNYCRPSACLPLIRFIGMGLDDSAAPATTANEDIGGGAVKSRHHDNPFLALLQLVQSAVPSPSGSSDRGTRSGDIGREAARGRYTLGGAPRSRWGASL